MNVFTAIGQTLSSSVAVLTTVARTVEKTVHLAETEVDLLKEEQCIRITTIKANHAILIEQSHTKQ